MIYIRSTKRFYKILLCPQLFAHKIKIKIKILIEILGIKPLL